MSTSISIPFAARDGELVLDGGRHFGPPAELVKGDFKRREPIAWAAANEFLTSGTTPGVVTITAA